MAFGVSFFKPQELLYKFYPELAQFAEAQQVSSKDEIFDILLLGASVLNDKWGNVASEIKKQFPADNIRIYNLTQVSHTSLDSFYKYRHLSEHRFDMVIFYHGINDTRMNNVPKAEFYNDYSHFSWYRTINVYERYRNFPYFAAPYAAELFIFQIGKNLGLAKYAPREIKEIPLESQRRYGRDFKSFETFGENLKRVAALAVKRGDLLVLATYVLHFDPNYSHDDFLDGKLDYSAHKSPIAIWGVPENVIEGVKRHNEQLRRISSELPGVLFVDLDKSMPRSAEYFDDVCHLTPKGSKKFVELLTEAIAGANAF